MLNVIVLDDEPFFIDLYKEIFHDKEVKARYYLSESDLEEKESIQTIASTDLIIFDYKLKGKTIVSLNLLDYVRNDLKFNGVLLVCSTLDHFAFDQDNIDKFANGKLEKSNLNWESIKSFLETTTV